MNIPKASLPEQGKHILGAVKVGQKGQIVIPKEARALLGVQPGDSLVVLVDEKTGLALMKTDKFAHVFSAAFPAQESEEAK